MRKEKAYFCFSASSLSFTSRMEWQWNDSKVCIRSINSGLTPENLSQRSLYNPESKWKMFYKCRTTASPLVLQGADCLFHQNKSTSVRQKASRALTSFQPSLRCIFPVWMELKMHIIEVTFMQPFMKYFCFTLACRTLLFLYNRQPSVTVRCLCMIPGSHAYRTWL